MVAETGVGAMKTRWKKPWRVRDVRGKLLVTMWRGVLLSLSLFGTVEEMKGEEKKKREWVKVQEPGWDRVE